MASVNKTGSVNPSAPLPGTSSSTYITPEQIYGDINSAQAREDSDRIKAQNPGVWSNVTEFFDPGAKDARLKRISTANQYDQVMQNLYAMVASIYQALVDPTASTPMTSATGPSTSQSTTAS